MKSSFLVAGCLAVIAGGEPVLANSLTFQSDASTLAAEAPLDTTALDTANTSGLTFGPAVVGAFGTFTPVPPGAPAATQVINIPPGNGQSGYFEVMFSLPGGFTNASITGALNVDDIGRAFLNGNALTDSLSASPANEFGNTTFSSSNQTFFDVGTNIFLVSDANTGGGPSGAAFYATVNYDVAATPIPAALPLFASGLGFVSLLNRRHKRKQTDKQTEMCCPFGLSRRGAPAAWIARGARGSLTGHAA